MKSLVPYLLCILAVTLFGSAAISKAKAKANASTYHEKVTFYEALR